MTKCDWIVIASLDGRISLLLLIGVYAESSSLLNSLIASNSLLAFVELGLPHSFPNTSTVCSEFSSTIHTCVSVYDLRMGVLDCCLLVKFACCVVWSTMWVLRRWLTLAQ